MIAPEKHSPQLDSSSVHEQVDGTTTPESQQRLKGDNSYASAALDLWGLTRSKWMPYIALMVTASFVILEARYNLDLLNTIVDPEASREVVQSLSDRGKFLAALGISWACGRTLLNKIRPAVLGAVLFSCLSVSVYFGLDHIYTTAIRDLPPELKVKGFRLFSYRQDLLTGRLSDPDIPLPQNEPVVGRLIMGALPIVLLDQRFMLPAAVVVERKVNDPVNLIIKKAEASWPDYDKSMRELFNGYREFQSGSKRAFAYRNLGGIEEFKKKSGGFTPDPDITMTNFINMLRNSDHPKGKELRESEAREIAIKPNGTAVLAGDLPKFMNQKQYIDWFSEQARQERDRALPTESNVNTITGIEDINSSIFLPPMAMIASLTSAITNGLTFLILGFSLIAIRQKNKTLQSIGQIAGRRGGAIMILLFTIILLFSPKFVFPTGPLRNLENTMHSSVGPAGVLWSRLSNFQVLLLRAQM